MPALQGAPLQALGSTEYPKSKDPRAIMSWDASLWASAKNLRGSVTWRNKSRPLPGPHIHCPPELLTLSIIHAHMRQLLLVLFNPNASPPALAQELGRGRGTLISTCSPTPKLERARWHQMCLPPPALGDGAGAGPDPHVPALQPLLGWRGLKSDQRKNSEMSCLFVFVTKQPLPSTQIYGLVFTCIFFTL